MDTGIYPSKKQVYEAMAIRAQRVGWESEVWTAETLECQNDDEAIALAQDFSKKWSSRIKLYRVPFVNTTSRASVDLWPDQVKLVADIPAPSAREGTA